MRVILDKHISSGLGFIGLAGVEDNIKDACGQPHHLLPDKLQIGADFSMIVKGKIAKEKYIKWRKSEL